MNNSGLLTIDAHGPLDEDCLDDTPLLVCDRGHIAIAWRDWDGPRCPICARPGTLSGVLQAEHERKVDELNKEVDERLDETEGAEERMRDTLRATRDLAKATFDALDRALR